MVGWYTLNMFHFWVHRAGGTVLPLWLWVGKNGLMGKVRHFGFLRQPAHINGALSLFEVKCINMTGLFFICFTGDEVKVKYTHGTDDTPLIAESPRHLSGLSGFRKWMDNCVQVQCKTGVHETSSGIHIYVCLSLCINFFDVPNNKTQCVFFSHDKFVHEVMSYTSQWSDKNVFLHNNQFVQFSLLQISISNILSNVWTVASEFNFKLGFVTLTSHILVGAFCLLNFGSSFFSLILWWEILCKEKKEFAKLLHEEKI